MAEWLEAIFWLSVFLIFHSYVLYPLIMMALSGQSGPELDCFEHGDELPSIAILIAARNEEKVIEEKIHSIYRSVYPQSKIQVYVGSDASDDRTNQLVELLSKKYATLQLRHFAERTGKIRIVNKLVTETQAEILVLTDANVMFSSQTLYELVKWFRDERVGLVAGNIVKQSSHNKGISVQEKKYLSFENLIKSSESKVFQLVMGAEGGCFALRRSLFRAVPSNFIVDDFFTTLQVINQDKFTLFNPEALCSEDVSSDSAGEYRRKVRISSGNFQNLVYFRNNLLTFWKARTFVFWSHKVLRWLTPFFIISALLSSVWLSAHTWYFIPLLYIQLIGLFTPVLDKTIRFKNPLLKFISHFYLMNLALLQGFFRFMGGIKSSVWQPVERNV